MPFSESKEGIIRYSQGQKWSEIGPWLVNVISGDGIGLPGVRMAALLADAFNSKTAACWRTNGRMAATLGVSPSAVIEGLRQLERNGHILSIMEPRNGKSMRHIYPKWNEGTARRKVRAPHGGVPKGTKPKTGPAAAVGEPIAVPKAAPTSTYEPARRAEDHGQKSVTRRSTSPDPDSLVVQLSEGGMPYLKSDLEELVRQTRFAGLSRSKVGTEQAPIQGTEPRLAGGTESARVRGTEGQQGEGAEVQSPIILEKSTHQSPTPIQAAPMTKGPRPAVEGRDKRMDVTGCGYPGCHHQASYVCEAIGTTFCVRHRGTSNRTVPIPHAVT
ncbi:hypothetical protein ACXR8U_06495 [Methylobacterium radiotolerans]|jgi:hypothetical protein|uniref:hypothetical protein n=1 Tax=Methylobacterium TaxID=407 RepID=UPI0005E61D18|nr:MULTISPECIES: hypothetical protein [Methylobacterium]MBN6822508.1 hypothetical protein [Methylobacterium organophilum]GAN47818.1 hypotheticalprotein [Methylobacterium sp. ME121]